MFGKDGSMQRFSRNSFFWAALGKPDAFPAAFGQWAAKSAAVGRSYAAMAAIKGLMPKMFTTLAVSSSEGALSPSSISGFRRDVPPPRGEHAWLQDFFEPLPNSLKHSSGVRCPRTT